MGKSYTFKKCKRKANIATVDKKSGDKEYGIGLSVTNLHIHAFLYNKKTKLCICGFSSSAKEVKSLSVNPGTVDMAKEVGKRFRESVDKIGIDVNNMYFNRCGYLFHGRVKAFHNGFFLISE